MISLQKLLLTLFMTIILFPGFSQKKESVTKRSLYKMGAGLTMLDTRASLGKTIFIEYWWKFHARFALSPKITYTMYGNAREGYNFNRKKQFNQHYDIRLLWMANENLSLFGGYSYRIQDIMKKESPALHTNEQNGLTVGFDVIVFSQDQLKFGVDGTYSWYQSSRVMEINYSPPLGIYVKF